jgi:hypothetical protein
MAILSLLLPRRAIEHKEFSHGARCLSSNLSFPDGKWTLSRTPSAFSKGNHYRCFAASPPLAPNDAAFMTGAGLVVDGGLTAQWWAQAVELRSSRAPLNPKVEVSDVDGWACSLVGCHRNAPAKLNGKG